MFNYENAPYIELKDYKAPDGINSIYIPMKDGKKIRTMYWRNVDTKKLTKGTVLLQQGHNEFIEKYFETIQDLIDKGFNVISFDWRGQGLSDRMIDNKHKQFIEDFSIHNDDLKFILDELVINNFPRPLIGIGHSMGGCILLSYLKENDEVFEKVILSAPMLGFRNERVLMPFISLVNIIFSKYSYLIGSSPNMGKETPFEGNDLTTDKHRYLRTQRLVRKNRDIRLWGVTNGWAKAVKRHLILMKKNNWAENIKTSILFINSLNDRVVSPENIISMSKRIKGSKIINFTSCEHEILMEKDIHRKQFWKHFDEFTNKLTFNN